MHGYGSCAGRTQGLPSAGTTEAARAPPIQPVSAPGPPEAYAHQPAGSPISIPKAALARYGPGPRARRVSQSQPSSRFPGNSERCRMRSTASIPEARNDGCNARSGWLRGGDRRAPASTVASAKHPADGPWHRHPALAPHVDDRRDPISKGRPGCTPKRPPGGRRRARALRHAPSTPSRGHRISTIADRSPPGEDQVLPWSG